MEDHQTLILEPLRYVYRDSCEKRTAGQLLAGARAGDSLAWRQLVSRCDGLVRATARRHRLQDCNVEDVSQATWLHLLESADRIQDVDRILGWLATTAARESLRIIARQRRVRPGPECVLEPQTDARFDPEARALEHELYAALHAAVDALPERRRRLVWTVASRSASYAEIASAIGVPIGSIGPTWQRCINQIRSAMLAQGFVPG